ncbi:hypothetical protein DSAG12_03268 [Promethearchaeum syntrophicum]|uniref:Uncharacterized protein n=1 Tax=Promethearchaeum syntrophicum TaxID=2594042 RepID=A0A5B9DEK7_9ARCH|nr:hypothetical protein [Candidatus Prometheoarchaeum syntrophicum]QEE17431.1 lipid A biosynthesis lauroyl acyltransferase [Candidatus Prometheoarchaeum syntrophicum]
MKNPEKSVKKNRAEQLKGIYKIISYIHQYKIFLPFRRITPSFLYMWGHLFGKLFVARPKLRRYVLNGLDFLFEDRVSTEFKEKIFQANAKYMASLVLDAMLYSPNIYEHTLNQFIEFKNLKYIDEALALKKGAIIVGPHAGMYFHLIAGLVYHPKKYNVLTINRARNQVMYENILKRPELTNLKAVTHSKFVEIKKRMISHLNQNGVLVILQDYSKKHNLQVPLVDKKYPLLITTPQSAIRIHKMTGTPIIPALIYPQGTLGKSLIEFQDPEPLAEISKQFWDSTGKIFHGEMSISINKIIYPYLIRYIHVWEELRKFSIRIRDEFELINKTTFDDFYHALSSKMMDILEKSYERDRNDNFLMSLISNFFASSKLHSQLDENLYILPIKIDLTGLNSLGKFQTLIKKSIEHLRNIVSNAELERWKDLNDSLKSGYNMYSRK